MDMTAALKKRLLPLYISVFFQGVVLWYPVEKLFMHSIGFDDALIGLSIAIYSAVMLATETPAGILADRWSRKGMLMLSYATLALCAIVGGLSNSVLMFIVASSLWGIYYAMYSGANDSIVYDVLEEEGHHPDLFEKAYGWVRTIDSAALVAGSLLGGVAAAALGTRATFYLSIPSAVLAAVALLFFREPLLHKAKAPLPLTEQIRTTLAAVLRNRPLVPVMVVLVLTATVEYILFEFAQLWLIALHAPTGWYGPANAVILAALGLGGVVAQYVRRSSGLMWALLALMVGGALALTMVHDLAGVIVAQFLVILGTISLGIMYLRKLHDGLTSQIRVGAASAVSTMGRAVIIPLALVFGAVSRDAGIFQAGWLLAGACLGMAVLVAYLQVGERRRKVVSL